MEDVISGTSALRFYRTPPHILAQYSGLPVSRERSVRMSLREVLLVKEVLGAPLYVLATSRKNRSCGKYIRQQLIEKDLPYGSICELEGFGKVVAPALMLLTLTRQLSFAHLVMAAYETCGSFALYKSPAGVMPNQQPQLYAPLGRDYWRQVYSSSGEPTGLWQRPPLAGIDELRTFVDKCENIRGAATLEKALNHVAGVTRSPFEAQTSMLLGMPRSLGGRGLRIETNKKIRLSRTARNLAKRDTCYADIYIESPDKSRALIVECQGAVAHSGERASISDANRTTALEAMGYDVVLLTYSHILYPDNFESVVRLIYKKLGMRAIPRSGRMRDAETALRQEIFIDWKSLEDPLADAKTKNRAK